MIWSNLKKTTAGEIAAMIHNLLLGFWFAHFNIYATSPTAFENTRRIAENDWVALFFTILLLNVAGLLIRLAFLRQMALFLTAVLVATQTAFFGSVNIAYLGVPRGAVLAGVFFYCFYTFKND